MVLRQDQRLHNVCCNGHAWLICVVFPDIDSVWGVCENPDCPKREFENDPYQGVSNHCLEDLEEMVNTRLEYEQ